MAFLNHLRRDKNASSSTATASSSSKTNIKRQRQQLINTNASRSPLYIPEILEQILEYLAPITLQYTVPLVCRLWRAVSQRVFPLRISWKEFTPDPKLSRELVLTKVDGVHKLVLAGTGVLRPGEEMLDSWVRFVKMVEEIKEWKSTGGGGGGEVMPRLRELVFTNAVNFSNGVFPVLRALTLGSTTGRMGWSRRMTSLKFENLMEHFLPLGTILRLCPQLVSFHAQATLVVDHTANVYFPCRFLLEPIKAMDRSSLPASLAYYPKYLSTSAERVEPEDEKPFPAKLRLQSLALDTFTVNEPALRKLLKACPDLRKLHLANLCGNGGRGVSEQDLETMFGPLVTMAFTSMYGIGEEIARRKLKATEDRLAFWEEVGRDLCPRLDSVQVGAHSIYQIPTFPEKFQPRFWACFPNMRKIGLQGKELYPHSFKSMTDQVLVGRVHWLTSLEITGQCYSSFATQAQDGGVAPSRAFQWALQGFLCEASGLLHFKAKEVPVFANFMAYVNPVFDSMGYYRTEKSVDQDEYLALGPAGPPPPSWAAGVRARLIEAGKTESLSGESSRDGANLMARPKIWACRNLITLHIQVSRTPSDSDGEIKSRVMFSYLSKVVPNLQELVLSRSCLNLQFEGGLCLLSRMKSLRRLELILGGMRPIAVKDLDWIMPRSKQGVFKKLRDQLVLEQHLAHVEKKAEQASGGKLPPRATLATKMTDRPHLVFDQGDVDMRNMGRLYDILDWMQLERDQGGFSCWPELKEMKWQFQRDFNDVLSVWFKDWIRKQRPEVKFEWVKK